MSKDPTGSFWVAADRLLQQPRQLYRLGIVDNRFWRAFLAALDRSRTSASGQLLDVLCPSPSFASALLAGRRPRSVMAFSLISPGQPRRSGLSASGGGAFQRLPLEIIHEVFACLSFQDLGHLALTHRVFRAWVSEWLPTRPALARLSPLAWLGPSECATPSPAAGWRLAPDGEILSLRQQCRSHVAFAVLCKRLTFLHASLERIRWAGRWFDAALAFTRSSEPSSWDWQETLEVLVYFAMLHAFTRGWDESEFVQVIVAVDRRFGLHSELARFVSSTSREDVCVTSEMRLRLVLRSLTWDFVGQDYTLKATWIMTILRRFVWHSPRAEAMTFFLLFGPPCRDNSSHYERLGLANDTQRVIMEELNNHADWSCFSDSSPEDFHEGKAMFYTMAQAICSCVNANKKWRSEHVSRLLDELFNVPNPWKRENVAGFLLFCSEKLILEYLREKLSIGSLDRIEDVARLLFDMILVSYRFDNDLSADRGIGKIFDLMCQFPTCREIQVKLFTQVWSIALLEMDTLELTPDEEELSEVVKHLGVHLMRHAYLNCQPSQGSGKRLLKENIDELEETMEE